MNPHHNGALPDSAAASVLLCCTGTSPSARSVPATMETLLRTHTVLPFFLRHVSFSWAQAEQIAEHVSKMDTLKQSSSANRAQPARAEDLLLLACLLYGRYSLGSGAVTDSACTMMPVTRHPPASLIA